MYKENLINNYGFNTDQHSLKIAQFYSKEKQTEQEKQKWLEIIPYIRDLKQNDSRLLIKMVRQGVIDSLRDKVWQQFFYPPIKPYEAFVNKQQLKQIDLDIKRTIPNHKNVQNIAPHLRRVLNAVAMALPKMGYCQGLNFIVATLLLKLDQQQAFNASYHILHWIGHSNLLINLDGIHKKVYVFEKLMKKHYSNLHKFLQEKQIDPLFYLSSWFITLYCGVLPISYSLRVLQIYFLEGQKIIYRVGLQILKIKKSRLKKLNNIQQLTQQLKNFDQFGLDLENTFFKNMFDISLSRKQIDSYEDEYDKSKNKKV